MSKLEDIKEWIKEDEEDNVLSSLISASRFEIKQATGITEEDVENNPDALELYNLAQKIIIANYYENRCGPSKTNPGLISLYMQLEAYGLLIRGEE